MDICVIMVQGFILRLYGTHKYGHEQEQLKKHYYIVGWYIVINVTVLGLSQLLESIFLCIQEEQQGWMQYKATVIIGWLIASTIGIFSKVLPTFKKSLRNIIIVFYILNAICFMIVFI